MPDFRVFCIPPATTPVTELVLSSEESHHLIVVNRARLGDPVVAFDGLGNEWFCTLTGNRKQAATLAVQTTRRAVPLPYALTLAQALPKGSVMDDIVRQATELGVARILPLTSERSQVHLDDHRQDRKVGKWQTTALEAAKQCGNPWLPKIATPAPLANVLAAATDCELLLVASLQPGAHSLKTALADFRAGHGRPPVNVLWLVGPEGDFSPAEMQLLQARGVVPITLGPLVLRCDTAAVCALSLLGYELHNQP